MSTKKSKKKSKREKKKQKKLEQVQAESVTFDVLSLLSNEQLDTKPNLGKFLNSYVKSIRLALQYGKIQVYPASSYQVSKVFVDFLDGHQLVFSASPLDEQQQLASQYFMYLGIDEIELSQKQLELVKMFFDFLVQFKFVDLRSQK